MSVMFMLLIYTFQTVIFLLQTWVSALHGSSILSLGTWNQKSPCHLSTLRETFKRVRQIHKVISSG